MSSFLKGLPSFFQRRGISIAKHAVSILLTLVGLMVLTFFIGRVMPIDPVGRIVGNEADADAYQAAYERLGFDQPLYVQFYRYVEQMLSGDFGVALLTGNSIVGDIVRAFPATVELATFALLVGVGIGVPLGIIAAVYRNRPVDHILRIITLLGHSSPIFWIGMISLIIFYAKLGWVGGSGRVDIYYEGIVPSYSGMILIDSLIAGETDVFFSAVRHIILPASVLGFSSMAYLTRMTRSFMLEQLLQEYIIAARVKGLSPFDVIWRHAFRNIRVQLVTIIALTYGHLLEGAVLIETVFAWPGFGQYLTNNLLLGDMNAVIVCVLLIGFIFMGLNLACDLLYRVFDPRTR